MTKLLGPLPSPADPKHRKGLVGRTLPRIYTRPLPGRRKGKGCAPGCKCGLTPETSEGFAVIEWAESIGFQLNPWQRWLLVHALELTDEGIYRFSTVLVLVARQNGKTLVKMVLTLYRLYVKSERLIVGTAQDRQQAKEVMNEGLVPMMLDNPTLAERFDPNGAMTGERRGIQHKTLGEEYLRLDNDRGPRYLIKTLNEQAGRGLWDVAEVNIDETRTQRDFTGWASVSKVVTAAENAQVWCMSNAGDSRSLLLNHLRSVGIAGTDEQMFLAEWSGEDECELDDTDAWCQANPSLGYTLTERAIRASLSDPPEVFRTEVLCQTIPSLNAAVDPQAWGDCADASGTTEGRDLVLCIEASEVGAVAAYLAAELDDGRVRLELAGRWPTVNAALTALPGLKTTFKPKAVGWFPNGPGSVFGAVMRKRLKGIPIRGAGEVEACMSFSERVGARRVLQPDDAVLTMQVNRTSKVGSKGSWAFDRSAPESIEEALAAAGAVYLALNHKRLKADSGILLPAGVDVAGGH